MRCSVIVKIVGVIAAFVIPLSAVAVFFMIQGPDKDLAFTRKEIEGDKMLRPLESLLMAAGRREYRPADGAKGAGGEIQAALQAVDVAQASVGTALGFDAATLEKAGRSGADSQSLRHKWGAIADKGAPLGDAETDFLGAVGNAITHAGDKSNLILDPELDSYYLMDVTLNTLITNEGRIAEMAGYMTAKGNTDAAARTQIAIYASKLQDDLDSVHSHFTTIYAENPNFHGISPSLKPNTEPALMAYSQAMTRLLDALSKNDAGSAGNIVEAADAAHAAASDLQRKSVDELDGLLSRRISDVTAARTRGLAFAVALLVAASIAAGFILRGISRPLMEAVHHVSYIRSGDFTKRIPVRSNDELSDLATAFNETLENLGEMMRNVAQKSVTMADLSEKLTKVSHNMGHHSEETSSQASVVAAACQQVNMSIQTVATGAEEMNASIKEIARNSTEVARVTDEAVNTTEAANLAVSKLGKSSAEIIEISKVIASIAEQQRIIGQFKFDLGKTVEETAEVREDATRKAPANYDRAPELSLAG